MRALIFVALVLGGCSSGKPGGGGHDMSNGGGSGGTGGGGGDMAGAGGGGDMTTAPPDMTLDAGASVLQLHKHATHDGVYVEPTFTKAALANLHSDANFDGTYAQFTGGAGPVYAQPLFVDNGGTGDVVIVATESNYVIAFDATTGKVKWHTDPATLGTAASGGDFSCGNVNPSGVTGTPVIDLGTRAIFLQTDVHGAPPKHMLHSLSIDDGKERAGWPIDVTSIISDFASAQQGQRGALVVVGDKVFVPFGGRAGDCLPYRGYVIGLPLSNPTAAAAVVFATKASDASGKGAAGGIWSPMGLSSDGSSIFFATGNAWGTFPTDWLMSYTEGTFHLGPSLAFDPNDSTSFYVPMNWHDLDTGDTDISGSGVLVADIAGATPHVSITLGKDQRMYIRDRTNLGGQDMNANNAPIVAGSEIINAPAVYTTTMGTWVAFRAACPGGNGTVTMNAVQITASPMTAWCANVLGGGSPSVTTTGGGQNSVVWFVASEGEGFAGDYKLRGFDGDTGAVVVTTPALMPSHRFISPIAAKGRMYVATDSKLYSFITQ